MIRRRRLDEDQRTGYPALFLVRRAPMIHLVGQLTELRIQRFQTVGGLQAHPQHGKQPQTMQGQRLLQAFVPTGHGGDVDSPQLLAEPAQGRSGLGIRRPLVGLLQPPAPGRLLALRQIPDDVLALVPLTALDQGLGSEHRLNGGAQPLGPVDDAEEAGLRPQPPLYQRPQERRTHRLVLGGRLDEAQELLLSLQCDPQGDDHRILRKRLAVEDHGHELVLVQAPLTEGPQVAGAGPDEAAGDTGGTQPKGGRHRLRTGGILPTGQAHQDLPEQAGIRRPRNLQPCVRGQRDLSVRAPITDSRDRDGQLLIGEVDRAWLLSPADHAGASTCPAVPGASQGDHLGLQRDRKSTRLNSSH